MKIRSLLFGLCLPVVFLANGAEEENPHAVFVVATPHYDPGATMPPLATQLKENFGWKTTVILPEGNPERSAKGIEGLEALAEADVAIFYLRFLTLPEDQLAKIEAYLKSGKPVVGFRTSTHAFTYPKDHELAKWNDGFGKDAMGSKYFIHGQGPTTVDPVQKQRGHEIFTGYNQAAPRRAAGTLYLSELPKNATVLMTGTGKFKRTGKVTNGFGTHDLKAEMTDDVAWTWENQWGGRVFGTTLGHPETFRDANFVRLFINGIHWAAGKPVPPASAKIEPIAASKEKQPKKVKASNRRTGSRADAGTPPKDQGRNPKNQNRKDAKNTETGKAEPPQAPELAKYGIYRNNAPNPGKAQPVATGLPLKLEKGDRIAFVGNTLFDRAGDFGHFESYLHLAHPDHELVIRNFSWAADEIDLQPRPDNFATVPQHLTREKIDVIFAAFGYNESFAGEDRIGEFRAKLTTYLIELKTSAFNGESGPRIVLVSPVANENVEGVPAGDLNNERLAAYTEAMAEVAKEQQVGFANVFDATKAAMADESSDLTYNGAHLVDEGYRVFADQLFRETFGETAPEPNEELRTVIADKNAQYFRRYRPLNTFYYTGGRNKRYGYLDFLPAMRNFEIMTANREQRAWEIARGKSFGDKPVDDSNVPPLDAVTESRGANEWLSPADELKAFRIDPRFEVNLFASEEEFPEIACPIQMRWDAKGRLWVSCSTTYPHVYPGSEPDDKIVILEDTDRDGKADRSTVWADDVHIPLSFALTKDGVYVSEEPHLSLIRDTDGDGKADFREKILTGFGCEDSHHALHDFVWTPDGDLLFRESIFHNSQVETPYGPVRAKNSAWFQFQPRDQKLVSFGAYPNTNPWGVTFDDWGHHVASHPIFATAFHATNPPYPTQHPKASGIPAYSGVCGHEFVDFAIWPEEMQGGFVKVRYKPTNRVEIHKWVEHDDHFTEEYVSDLIFSENLSFIPVDLRYGPRGAMYVCDWYNPVKGHAQYSLRDPRRDRKSGRIWRIVPKGAKLPDPPEIAGATIEQLLDNLKRPEYRYRYWSKRELRDEHDPEKVEAALNEWAANLEPGDPRFRHHQVEALWMYRNIGAETQGLFVDLLGCENHLARAAAVRQLRYWHDPQLWPAAIDWLRKAANDENGIVRMEAVNAASYIGTKESLEAILGVLDHPMGNHLKYSVQCALGSEALSRHWKGNEEFLSAHPKLTEFSQSWAKHSKITAGITTRTAGEAQFDSQKNLAEVEISCVPERMLYTKTKFAVKAGQPVKLIFTNPDATQHNLVIVEPGALEEVGMAGNEMAKDPAGITKGFVPDHRAILHHTKLLNPDTGEVLRFNAPEKPGTYPYLCTFPGHWIIMKGEMVVE